MIIRVVDFGDAEKIEASFVRMAAATNEFEPVMGKIIIDMFRVEKQLFRSQGRRGGGSWASLKEKTVEKKGMPIIMFTEGSNPFYKTPVSPDLLYKSLTEAGAPYQIVDLGKKSISLGTSRPGAASHEYGSRKRNIPKRPLLRFTIHDMNRWKKWIAAYLVAAYRDVPPA